MNKQNQRRTMFAFWGFVGPMVLGVFVFTYLPMIWGLILSLFEAKATIEPKKFVGLENYIYLLTDEKFLLSLRTVAAFTVFIVPITVIFALLLALLVNNIRLGSGIFRSVFFIPTACSYVIASLVWKMSIFNGLRYGVANSFTNTFFDLAPIDWIGTVSPPYYWLVLVSVRLWLQVGLYMIILLAALQDIPKELYEAAFVDGARKGWTTFRFITLPSLRNALIAVLLLNLIAAFQAFDEFYNIMGGGAAGGGASGGNAFLARTPLVYLYTIAFGDRNYGRGSAGAFILAAIILVVTITQGRLFGFGRSDSES
ncbi:MAG: sugar ABC transporter permease [Anaerolineae bacterium]|nr:sugar ABC transporter permease [Anaerolineae bacterium]